MFSLRSNGLAWAAPLHPGGAPFGRHRPPHSLVGGSFMTAETTPPRKGRGGRPKGDPSAVRASTIGVRVSAEEYAALRAKADQMGMTPAQWLREAALSRRLVTVADALLQRLAGEVGRLRLALIGAGGGE